MEKLSLGNWCSDLEMDDHVNECHANSLDDEFLRDILQTPEEATAPVAAAVLTTSTVTTTAIGSGNSLFGQTSLGNSSSIISQLHASKKHASSSSTYVLSFDKSTALLPSIHDPCSAKWKWNEVSQSQLGSRGTDSSPLSSSRTNLGGTKNTRGVSKSLDHIMKERKRRQELTKKFIALSATIPGLKKMDKAHVLNEAINYVKQLQQRVKELEEDIQKSGAESVIAITRSHLFIEEGTFGETNSSECYRANEAFPEVEARLLGKEVLIKIHCAKQKGILPKILYHLELLHLSVATINVLPFGNTLDITIIAQMGDKYSTILKDLVKKLRLVALLKPCDVQQRCDVAYQTGPVIVA